MSHDQKALYKLGTLDERGSDVELRYGNVYDIEKTTGGSRLEIAPADGHDLLLGDLVELIDGPYHLLYVLLVSRLGRDEGRYYHPENDAAEDWLFAAWDWIQFPLEEQDEWS